ncbi:helix-turn-helix transcriptional regulator [Tateyamaria omphalii]|uniref:helix-turn-helix transcriptional regulator n=1 Tax=Tateyamaria omphalii TaxID=299262 RepID=UPI001C991A48|nr:helix-turn-helix transcriptional regulator [Tateyamaria omphalii]MBY5934593.1 helix-turn-helix transcriptional regulator [Tateyamaria omphalii]
MTSPKPIPDGAIPMIARLATRVRAARDALGLPRRELSERSGVSPRYLAQLEAGEGNISVILLERVATALNLRIEDLLSEAPPMHGDVARVARLYQAAPAQVQGRVRALLAPQNPLALRAQRICLVGLRGAGKSTLGRMAAAKLKIPFVELNEEIEAEAGMPLSEVMALYGQDGYRALEAEAVARVVDRHDKLILAVAGGIVGDEAAYDMLLERFHTVWIRTSPGEHMARVRAQGDLRPMEGNPVAMEQLKALLSHRTPAYERAMAQVDTAAKPVSTSLNELLAIIAKYRFLEGLGP